MPDQPPPLRTGTSSFTAPGWKGSFYPAKLPEREFLHYYAGIFNTVEVDSTFYHIPPVSTVERWREATPPGFLFALKTPQVITHERCLKDCALEWKAFLQTVERLGDRLGPILLQFPYYRRTEMQAEEFLERLRGFLPLLPEGWPIALEIRNRGWVSEPLLDLLREHHVAFTLIDHPWMDRPLEIVGRHDIVTSNFSYIRLLGDRHAMERLTNVWDRTLVDRTPELREWVQVCRRIREQKAAIYIYANNHFAGHSPETLRQFLELWKLFEPETEVPPAVGPGETLPLF
jgi:uncharacterized protein YecE (DUF72 family)